MRNDPTAWTRVLANRSQEETRREIVIIISIAETEKSKYEANFTLILCSVQLLKYDFVPLHL